MSDHPMLDLAPIYTLDALEEKERVSFETHLTTCAECEEAVDEYRAVVSALVADEPASELTWHRIRQSIGSDASGSESPTGASPAWRWIAGIAAAVALVFGALIAIDLMSEETVPLTSEGIVAAAGVAADEPGSFLGEFLVEDVAVATVILADDGRGFVLPTDDLSPIDSSRTYQLWVINDTEDVISAGVLGSDPGPATFTWTGGVSGFALTREVAGGVVSSEGDVVSVITDA